MSTSTWTMVVGGAAGIALAVFGAGMLVTGRAPDATQRAFRSVREAGLYHLLFGLGLAMVVFGTAFGGGIVTMVATVAAIRWSAWRWFGSVPEGTGGCTTRSSPRAPAGAPLREKARV